MGEVCWRNSDVIVCVCYYLGNFEILISDVVAEWSKALDLGSSLSWRGFKSHRHQFCTIHHFANSQQPPNTFYFQNACYWLQCLVSNVYFFIHTTNIYYHSSTTHPYSIYFASLCLNTYLYSYPTSLFHLNPITYFCICSLNSQKVNKVIH